MAAFIKTIVFVTSSYGYRDNPTGEGKQFHNGIDLRAKFLPLYSPEPGTVETVNEDSLNGKFVVINHGNRKTVYCHLSQIDTYEGAELKEGDSFAVTGESGNVTGPHLHFGLKEKNEAGTFDFINPLPYVYAQNIKLLAKYSAIPVLVAGGIFFLTTKV
jgi:murein DD-endopeptidase MepM/ murein hydrolase activator NlpD